jgi:hypothetical protein
LPGIFVPFADKTGISGGKPLKNKGLKTGMAVAT